jgi:hypothetical protein
MNSVTNRYTGRQAPSLTRCEPTPEKCSTCGMLECLCQPRFFAGQVLTADDLNRLKHYITAKNRLHNRQLHGWGVVNGLEVTCNDCGDGVVVSCGYALSPCGDDIVVCDPVVVDICALIAACRQSDRNCEPPRRRRPEDCDDEEAEWILAIRYTESPSRGVKPLIPSNVPGCGCSSSPCRCGHSSVAKSKCGCGGSTAGACGCKDGSTKSKARTAPVQCEPTIVCEGFAFDVYKKPVDLEEEGGGLNPDSELVKRFQCCIELLTKPVTKMPGAPTPQNIQSNVAAWHQWICGFKGYLQRYFSRKPGYNCELLVRLNQVVCPPLNSQNVAAVLEQSLRTLQLVWLDALLACFCSALLPPCPEAAPNGCVPLASIRVSPKPCRVLSICNWTVHRKFATTFPALQYWLSILPFGTLLRQLLDRICCLQINDVVDQPNDNVRGVAGGAANPGAAPPAAGAGGANGRPVEDIAFERAAERLNPPVDNPERLNAASRLAFETFARGTKPFEPRTFIESAFLADADKGAGHLSAADLENMPQFLALNQLLRPIALGLARNQQLGDLVSMLGGLGATRAAAGDPASEVAALRKEVADLREDLQRIGRARKRKG